MRSPGGGGPPHRRPAARVQAASRHELLRSALDHDPRELTVTVDGARPATIRVERRFEQPLPPLTRVPSAAGGERQEECSVDRVAGHMQLPIDFDEVGGGRQRRSLDHVQLRPPRLRPERPHAELVDGQCPRLVGGDDGRGAECLHRAEPANDRAAPRHRARPLGERDRDGGSEPFRDGRHGDGNPDEKRLLERFAASEHPEGEEPRDGGAEGDHGAGKRSELALKRCRRWP